MLSRIIVLTFFILMTLQSRVYSQKVLPDSLLNKSNTEKAIFLNATAQKQQSLDSSLFYTRKAIEYAKESDNDSLLFNTNYNLSFYPAIYGKYNMAINNISSLDSLLQQRSSPYFMFRKTTLLAYAYKMKDQLNTSLNQYKEAINYAKQYGDSLFIGDAYNNIGDAYLQMELRKEAHKYFKYANTIYDKLNIKKGVRRSYILNKNLGMTSSNFREASVYFKKAIAIAKQKNNLNDLALAYLAQADGYVNLKRYKEASIAAKKAYKYSDSIHFDFLKNIALLQLGQSNLNLKHYNTAINYLEEALKIKQDNLQNHQAILENLSKAYAAKGAFKKAYESYSKAQFVKDSMNKLKSSRDFAEFDTRFKTSEKDKEIAEQQLQLARQKITKNIYISVSIILFAMAVALFQWLINKQKRKKLLTEVQLQKEQELNEVRTKFLGNIAHEIRTPLTLISGNLDIALENINNKEKIQKNIRAALANSKKVVEDANEILELLKYEKNKTTIKNTTVNLNATIKRIFLSFKSFATLKKIDLKYQSTIDTNLMVNTDVEKLEKILNNLVSNAIKYSNSDTSVILEANIKNDKLCIDVTDFGQGIHFDETEKIFQRFYQASNSKSVGGIGIGLSLAREFAVLLNGSLTVKSSINKGSTFSLIIPVNKADIEAFKTTSKEITSIGDVPISKDTSSTQQDNKPKILIVEDNPEMNDFLKEILSNKYNCTCAFNGFEALKILEKQIFDLITSDIMMPRIDGFKLREKINENPTLKDIPFILISAKTLTEDKIKGFKLGIDDYIVKPFNKNELLARIANLLSTKNVRQKWQTDNKNVLVETESSDKKLLSKIENIVIENLSDDTFKVEKLAAEVGYSQRQLARILKQYTGLSPIRFILEIRLQKAYQLLKNKTHFTLAEVRYDIGINSTSYFNAKFKERFGIAPGELLK
jgi:signal transduction histidine kinase/DNA-binding response OmpR family regulator